MLQIILAINSNEQGFWICPFPYIMSNLWSIKPHNCTLFSIEQAISCYRYHLYYPQVYSSAVVSEVDKFLF